MSESVEVRLARIEEMLRAHFDRIDERCGLRFDSLSDLENRVTCLEEWQAQTKGGWMVLSAVSAASATVGGLVVKLVAYMIEGGR